MRIGTALYILATMSWAALALFLVIDILSKRRDNCEYGEQRTRARSDSASPAPGRARAAARRTVVTRLQRVWNASVHDPDERSVAAWTEAHRVLRDIQRQMRVAQNPRPPRDPASGK